MLASLVWVASWALVIQAAPATSPLPVKEAVRELVEGAESRLVLSPDGREWRNDAIRKLWKERASMGHTPLIRLPISGLPNADIYLKNETATASGTLKHRFVWALALWAVVEGRITENTTVYDSTSGNTGASEAYMCRLLGVPYYAVVSVSLEQEKVDHIKHFGGQIIKVDAKLRNKVAEDSANANGGFFMNQFGNSDAAEEYHESGQYKYESSNVFHEIVQQVEQSYNRSIPHMFVHSAGTGGTISSVGKYITRYGLPTRVVLSDSQHSLFYGYVTENKYTTLKAGENGRPEWKNPGVAGIGYGYNVDPIIFKRTTSLLRSVVDEAVRMPDMASAAAMRSLRKIGVDAGPSTALNFLVALHKAILHQKGHLHYVPTSERFSVVTINGDPGKFYESTYHNDDWIDKEMAAYGGLRALACWQARIDDAIEKGTDFVENGKMCDPAVLNL